MRVTFDDAMREIAGRSRRAQSWVDWWRRKYAAIIPAVEGFAHEQLFDVSSSDVAKTLERGIHALEEITKASELKIVEDLPMPPTAVQDLFHRFLERQGALPTWPEFREFLHEPVQRTQFLDPWWRDLRSELPKDLSRERVGEAIQWRLGKMYYSNMREVDMLARLRERYDIRLKYHIFADVRLRTDFWLGDVNVSVFLSNARYRGNDTARKHKAKDFLADAIPAFCYLEIEFPNLRDFGKLYRVSDDDLARLAADIQTG